MDKPIKLYTVTGFLGSGKTSFLKHMLGSMGTQRIGVIQNEFGKVGIDGDIIRRDGLEMIEINRGSIFCSCLQLKFVDALVAMRDKELDHLFVEGSGLADPSNMNEILDAVHGLRENAYEYCGAICVVDGAQFLEQLEEIETVHRQVKHAQVAIINKTDLIGDDELARVKSVLKDINSDIMIDEARQGLPTRFNLEESFIAMRPGHFDVSINAPENKPKTLHLTTSEVVNEAALKGFLEAVKGDCYRIKGFIHLESGWAQVDAVGQRVDFQPVSERTDSSTVVFISKVGNKVIKPIFEAWETHVGTEMKVR